MKKDFCSKKGKFCGAKGLTVEQVVRIAILKQITQLSYLKLYDALNDNLCYRNFTKIYDGKVPKANTLCENIKRIKPQSWKKINRFIIGLAKEKGIEKGSKVRIDTTGVESNIHHPTDVGLLWDCIRVISRIIKTVKEEYPGIEFKYSNHGQSAKRRGFKIINTSRKEHRRKTYAELLKISAKVKGYRISCVEALSKKEFAGEVEARIYRGELAGYISACKRAYGLDRCTWKGWESLQSYVWVSIIAFNLNVIAEKLL